MPDSLRAFVAVDVDERIRQQVTRVQNAFQSVAAGAKWVEPALCHITLKFLGYVPAEQVPAIAEAGRLAAAAAKPFELSFRGIGAFPRWRGARVLWMGLGGGEAPLTALQAALEKELALLGFEPEGRPFSPHLTLARFQQPPGQSIQEVALRFQHEPFGSVSVSELRLMRSHLSPGGANYSVIEAFPLG